MGDFPPTLKPTPSGSSSFGASRAHAYITCNIKHHSLHVRHMKDTITNKLTAQTRVLLEKQIIQLVKKLTAPYGIKGFINMFKTVWFRHIQPTPSYLICLRFNLILLLNLFLCLACLSSLQGFSAKSLYSFLVSPMHTTCFTHFTHNFITLIIYGEAYKLRRPSIT
jgi:hypothetical protein